MNINKTKSSQVKSSQVKSLCLIASLFASGIFVNNANAKIEVFSNTTSTPLHYASNGLFKYAFRLTLLDEKRTLFYVDNIIGGPTEAPYAFNFIVKYNGGDNYSIYVPNYDKQYEKEPQIHDAISALKTALKKNKATMKQFLNAEVHNMIIDGFSAD